MRSASIYSAWSTRHQAPGRLRNIAMRTFDLTGADRQIVGQGVMIVQVVPPTAQIAMASAHRRLIVVYFGSFDVAGERRQRLIETPGFERFLLRVHPGVKRRGVLRNRLGGGAQILANMIKINQVAALRPARQSVPPLGRRSRALRP